MILVTLSLLVPLLVGLAFIGMLSADKSRPRFPMSLHLTIAVGAGFGLLSVLFFLWLALTNTGTGFRAFALLTLAVLVVAWVRRLKSAKSREPFSTPAVHPPSKLRWVLIAVFLFVLCSSSWVFVSIASKKPHGEWDAWASWNMKARFLFRGEEHWSSVFSNLLWYSGADYPLLLPASVAGCWTIAGNDTPAVPALIALSFTIATAGVLFASVTALRGLIQGSLAGLTILMTPSFVLHGTSQYADVPLSFFLVASIALLHIHESRPRMDRRLLLLSGVMGGLAAWTKNEGLLFVMALVVSRFVVDLPTLGLRESLNRIRDLAKCFVPSVLLILLFKLVLVEANPLLAWQGQTTIDRLTDWSRYRVIFRAFTEQLVSFGGTVPSVWLILGIYLVLAGVWVRREERSSVTASSLSLVLMLGGFFVVYLLTPFDLEWHLSTTLSRLLLQLWPSLIFLVFIVARPFGVYRMTPVIEGSVPGEG